MILPKISVITVSYNAQECIEKTIRSVIRQSYNNVEYIIVDGASKDGTIDIIEQYKDFISTIICEPDKGIYDAMNKGITAATGEWIIFMNTGDVFASNDVLTNIFTEPIDISIGVLYGNTTIVEGRLQKTITNDTPFWMSREYIPSIGINHQSIFTRTSLAKQNPFNLNYKVCADYEMMNTLHKSGAVFKYVCQDVAKCFVGDGFSNRHKHLSIKERAIIVGRHKTIGYQLYLLQVYTKTRFKKIIISTIGFFYPQCILKLKNKHGWSPVE